MTKSWSFPKINEGIQSFFEGLLDESQIEQSTLDEIKRQETSTSSQPSLSRKGPSAREAVRCAKLSNSAMDTCVRRAQSGAGTPRLVI